MKKRNMLKALLQAAATLLYCIAMLTACSDDSTDDGKLTQEEKEQQELQKETEEVKKQIAGSWVLDGDGMAEYDAIMTEYTFSDTLMTIKSYSYDYDSDSYLQETLDYSFRILPCTTTTEGEIIRLQLKPDKEAIAWMDKVNQIIREDAKEWGSEPPALITQDDLSDTLQLIRNGNVLSFLLDQETMDYYASEGYVFETNLLDIERGHVVPDSLNSKALRTEIEEMMQAFAEYEALFADDSTSVDMAKLKRRVHRASETQHIYDNKGRELRQWMKDIPDDRMLCKMMIPGAHDAGTYGMYWDWLRTLAKTQDQDISGQWDHGIRYFDLRVRFWNDENRLYHDLISCDVTMKDVFQQIQNKLRENPKDGAIITVKVEGNNAEDLWSGWEKLTTIVPLNITRGRPDNVATTKETLKLAEEYFLNQTVDGHPMLAKFHPDMTMKDLRGRVVVMLQDAPSEKEVDYGRLKDYLGLEKEHTYANMMGDSRPVREQNDWEQHPAEEESTRGYLLRKTTKFRRLLFETVEDTEDIYWVYNAANGYYRDVMSITDMVPDYATYAQEAYPIFTRDILRYGNPRGIVLIDHVGWDHFKRVKIGDLSATGTGSLVVTTALSLAVGIGAGVATAATGGVFLGVLVGAGASAGMVAVGTGAGTSMLFGTHWTSPTFYLFWLNYKIAKLAADYKDPKAQDLINAIVEVNFPEQRQTGISTDPVDVAR